MSRRKVTHWSDANSDAEVILHQGEYQVFQAGQFQGTTTKRRAAFELVPGADWRHA